MISCTVCIVGGGPAGATMARRLAHIGHDVCVVERAPFPRPHVGESLAPSILPLFEELGLRDRIEDAGFLRPHGSLVRWGASGVFVKGATGERGFQVDRDRFDALLLGAARDAGVRVLQPASLTRIDHLDGSIIASLGDGTSIRAGFLVDAAGRSGVLPRARERTSTSTAALYAYWDSSAIDGHETRIEAGESAWYWGAPLPSGAFNATVFVDARRCRGLTAAARQAFYCDLIGQSALLAACVRGRQLGRVHVCDATPFVDTRPIADTTIKIGEAALAVDPLSSQGVQIAMRTALQAAAVVHTAAHFPERAALARRFYRERVTEAAGRHATLAADAYAEARTGEPNGFWSNRASRHPRGSAPTLRQAAVPKAVVLSPLARVEPSPVLEDDVICEGAALRHPNLERSVAFLGGVALAPLLRAASVPHSRDELIVRWTQYAPASVCRLIFGWLWQRGVLEDAQQGCEGAMLR